MGIQFDTGELRDVLAVCGDGGGSDAKERIKQAGRGTLAMKPDALFDECDGKSRRMRTFLVPGADGFVGNEPVVTPATEIRSAGVAPAGDVGFVLIGNACGPAVELGTAGFCQVKDVFVAVVDEALGVDGFEVARTDQFVGAGFDRNRFDPMECILKFEQRIPAVRQREDELVGKQRVHGRSAHVQEERSVLNHDSSEFGHPLAAPAEELPARCGVFETFVGDAEIIGGRGDDQIDGFRGEGGQDGQAVAVEEIHESEGAED